MDKIIYNVSSFKRKNGLINTINSVLNQCDVINVFLNDYDEIPLEMYHEKINIFLTDNSKGDAYKFYELINSTGYYFTIDDDIIYPENYTEFMIENIEKYNRKKIITLHGRNFQSFPIQSYYSKNADLYHFTNEIKKDVVVKFGGTGVMAFHTDLIKERISFFETKNMADIWIGVLSKINQIDIICVKHNKNFLIQQKFQENIFEEYKGKDNIQTKIVNTFFKNKLDLSILIPTYKNVEFLDQCLDSIIKKINHISYEILVGIDGCLETLEYVKNKKHIDPHIQFFFFEKNNGPYIVKNTLSKLSNSQKLLFFDSDDLLESEMMSVGYNLLDKYDCVKPQYVDFTEKKGTKNFYKQNNTYGEGVFLIRKNVFEKLKGFEPWLCAADSEFHARLGFNGYVSTKTNESCFLRRIHPLGLTSRKDTGWGSQLRNEYVKMINNKKNWEPLTDMVTANYQTIHIEYINNFTTEPQKQKLQHNKEQKNNILQNIFDKTNKITDFRSKDEKRFNILKKTNNEILKSKSKPTIQFGKNILPLNKRKIK